MDGKKMFHESFGQGQMLGIFALLNPIGAELSIWERKRGKHTVDWTLDRIGGSIVLFNSLYVIKSLFDAI